MSEKFPFVEIPVDLPAHDADVVIRFPGGKELLIQARPSNADVNYNGSLDIVLPDDTVVTNWRGDDMESAPEAFPGRGRPHERTAKQLVVELPGDYEEFFSR